MRRLGLVPFLNPEIQSFIITAFHSPTDPAFQFSEFYHRLSDRGMIIYPGKLTRADTFRIGTIGRLFERLLADLHHRLDANHGVTGSWLRFPVLSVRSWRTPWD